MAAEFKTTFLTSWDKCISDGKTHCIDNNYMSSYCCDYPKNSPQHQQCIDKHSMCTNNVT